MQYHKINEKFKDIISADKLGTLLDDISLIAYRNTIKFQEYFPLATDTDGIYTYSDTFYDSWHGGWWTGIFYLAYEACGDEKLRHYAENLSAKFYALIKNKRIIHREMGFIYLPVCIPDIKYNQNSEAAESVILAAQYMMEAFGSSPVIGNRSGEDLNIKFENDTIFRTSTLVNSYILMLAAKISGNTKFADVARLCNENTIKYNIAPEGKCYMGVHVDMNSGSVISVMDDPGNYGFDKNGDYTRGYAWAALGLALHHDPGRDDLCEERMYALLNYFLSLSDGNLCVFMPCDKQGKKLPDTTSASIFLCAFAEILKKLTPSHKYYSFYYGLLKKWMNHLTEYSISAKSGRQGFIDRGILLGGVGPDKGMVKNGSNICGDYFWLEALMHMCEGFESYWNIDKLFIKRQEE